MRDLDSDTLWGHVDTERAWLADLLESLTPEQWEQPSLCAGWTVRDVGAHLTFSHARLVDLVVLAVRAGFRYDTVIDRATRASPLTHEQIVATLRSFVGSRARIAFISDLDPLLDIVVHTQDVCIPLGIDHPVPVDAAAAAADRVLDTRPPLRRWRGPRGVRLVATDVDWARGAGTEVRAAMQDHLLVLTGRRRAPWTVAVPGR